jgi:hypothetical protein
MKEVNQQLRPRRSKKQEIFSSSCKKSFRIFFHSNEQVHEPLGAATGGQRLMNSIHNFSTDLFTH